MRRFREAKFGDEVVKWTLDHWDELQLLAAK
jgi:hypothetical protein